MSDQIIIGVPGFWKDREEILVAIASAGEGANVPQYLAAGNALLDTTTNERCEFEIYEHDPNMSYAFEVAGQGKFSDKDLDQINRHEHSVYLLSQGQSICEARKMLRFAALLLDAGGYAVKVETSGVAHQAEHWRYYANSQSLLSLYDALVVLVGGDDYNFTCGMQSFGLPDVSVTDEIDINEAPEILNAFNQWHLLESPHLEDGMWFSTAATEPDFAMTHCEFGYDATDLMNNRFGRWHLELSDARPANTTGFQDNDAPIFMRVHHDDPDIIACVKQARETAGQFLDHFRCPFEYGQYFVKTRIQDGGEHAQLWLHVTDESAGKLTAEVFEIPDEFENYSVGESMELRVEEIFDWSIIRNGTLIGGFSRRLARNRLPEKSRVHFDQFSGTISYARLDDTLLSSASDEI